MSVISICIPTYNRASLLTKALAAIAEQLDAATAPQVDLIIADNASPDDTTTVVTNFRNDHPDICLTYHRQTENLGADANINALFQLATAPWMFLLSDDDILMPGAIAMILTCIAANPGLVGVILNSKSFIHNINEETPLNLAIKPDNFTFTDKNEVLQFLGTFITFMSVMVFRREIIADQDYKSRIGTSLPQSYMFLDVICSDGAIAVISSPCLAVLSNNTGGYNFFKVFVTSFAELMVYAENKGGAPETIRSVLRTHQRFVLNFIKLFKVSGSFGRLTPDYADGIRRINAVYRGDLLFLLRALPLMLMPARLIHLMYDLRRWVRSRLQSRTTIT